MLVSLDMFTSVSDWFRSSVKEVPFSTEEKLILYGLYKQGKHGSMPETMKRPTNPLDLKGRAKYDSWKRVSGLSAAEARQSYLDLLFEKTENYLQNLAQQKGYRGRLFSREDKKDNNNLSITGKDSNSVTLPTSHSRIGGHRHKYPALLERDAALLSDMPRWMSVFDSYRAIVMGEREGTSFFLPDGYASSSSESDSEESEKYPHDSDLDIAGSETQIPRRHKRTVSAPVQNVVKKTQAALTRVTELESSLEDILADKISKKQLQQQPAQQGNNNKEKDPSFKIIIPKSPSSTPSPSKEDDKLGLIWKRKSWFSFLFLVTLCCLLALARWNKNRRRKANNATTNPLVILLSQIPHLLPAFVRNRLFVNQTTS